MGVKTVNFGKNSFAQTIRQAAREYIKHGLFPVPIPSGKKRPVVKDWPNFSCTEHDVDKHFSDSDSIGLILKSSKLLDVDFDCPEAVAFADMFPNAWRMVRKSKLPSHLVYRIETDAEYEKFVDPKTKEIVIEFRTGNSCMLSPPSMHTSGEQLGWQGKCPPPIVVPDEILRLVACVAAFSLLARYWPNTGSRHECALAVAGLFVRAGLPEEFASAAMQSIAEFAGDDEVSDRIDAVKTTYEKAESCEAFTGIPTLKAIVGGDVTKVIVEWLGCDQRVVTEIEQKIPLKDYVLSYEDLMASEQPPVEYIVTPWLPTSSIAMLYGLRGSGKSLCVMELALSVAMGKPLFDCWDVSQPRRVLLIDGEMSLRILKHRLEAMSKHEATTPCNLKILPGDLLGAVHDSLNIAEADTQQRVDQMLQDMDVDGWRPELIILDNLSSLTWGIDENSNTEQDAVNRWLISLRSRGYAVLTVHHTTKDGKAQRGASRREDILDTSIHLKPEDNVNTRFTIQFTKLRGEKPTPLTLTVTMHKGEDGSFLWSADNIPIRPYLLALKHIHEEKPKSVMALGKLMSVSHTQAGKYVNKLVEMKTAVKKPLGLTTSGIAMYKLSFQNDGTDSDSPIG